MQNVVYYFVANFLLFQNTEAILMILPVPLQPLKVTSLPSGVYSTLALKGQIW